MTFKATASDAHEPVVRCPHCSHDIRLTESLAAPLLEENRRRFQEQMAQKDAEIARKTEVLLKERDDLARARDQVEDQIKQRLAVERDQLVAAEAKKAREAAAAEIQATSAEAAELRRTLEANNIKLAEAQKAQADAMRQQRELDDEKREIDLTVEKRVQSSVEGVRIKARQDADDAAKLRISEKDHTIESMTRTIESSSARPNRAPSRRKARCSNWSLRRSFAAGFRPT